MAKVPCWNYCDLSVSLMVTVAHVLHCSKWLPGSTVYSSLSINLSPYSEQQLFVKISFVAHSATAMRLNFFFLHPEGVSICTLRYIEMACIFWGKELNLHALWLLQWGRGKAEHHLPSTELTPSAHKLRDSTRAGSECRPVYRTIMFLIHYCLQVLQSQQMSCCFCGYRERFWFRLQLLICTKRKAFLFQVWGFGW